MCCTSCDYVVTHHNTGSGVLNVYIVIVLGSFCGRNILFPSAVVNCTFFRKQSVHIAGKNSWRPVTATKSALGMIGIEDDISPEFKIFVRPGVVLYSNFNKPELAVFDKDVFAAAYQT